MASSIALNNSQTAASASSDYKFVLDRRDNGVATITLQHFEKIGTDANGQAVMGWVTAQKDGKNITQSNAGWDDAIPWAQSTSYHLKYSGGADRAGSIYHWQLPDNEAPAGREAIFLHQGNLAQPSQAVHGCIGANVGIFLQPAHDVLASAGELGKLIPFEVHNDFNYSISVSAAASSVNEGEETTFTVRLSDPISKNLWVRINISDDPANPHGIATQLVDYSIKPQTPGLGGIRHVEPDYDKHGGTLDAGKWAEGWYVQIPAGQSSATYVIHAPNDTPETPPEGDEKIDLQITDYFVQDDLKVNGPGLLAGRAFYSDYKAKEHGGHGVLLNGAALPTAAVTIIDKGNLLTAHLSGGIEGLLRTFNVTKGDIIDYGFQAYSIPDKLSITGGTPTVDTGGFVSDFHSGSITAAQDTITVIVVGSSAGTAWDLDLTEHAPPNPPASSTGASSSFASASLSATSTFLFWPDGTLTPIDSSETGQVDMDDGSAASAQALMALATPAQSVADATLHLTGSQTVAIPVGGEAQPAQFSVEAGKDYLVRVVGAEGRGQSNTIVDPYLKLSEVGSSDAPFVSHDSDILNEPALFFHASSDATISVVVGSDDSAAGGTGAVELYDASSLSSPIVFLDGDSGTLEGGDADFTLHRVGDVSQAATYRLLITPDGASPLSADDLQGGLAPIDVKFEAGQSVASVAITALSDSVKEGVETAHVSLDPTSLPAEALSNAALLGLKTDANLTVDDSDPSQGLIVFPTVSATQAEASESDGHIDFKLTLSEVPNVAVSLSYTTFDGSAQAGLDYTPQAGTVTFQPAQTEQTISVSLSQDGVLESDETMQLKVLDPSGLYLPNNAVVMSVNGIIHDSATQFEYQSTYDAQGRLDTATVKDHATGNTYFTDYDQGDTFPWTTAISGYGPDGKLDYVTMKMDNGQTFYTDYNQNGSNPWAMAITGYDDQDRLDYVTIVNKDGSSAFTDYDQANTRPDQYSIHYFDPSNKLVHSFVQFDNGFHIAT